MNILMVDLHLFAFNCNESFRIVVDKKEKRAKLFLFNSFYIIVLS